MLKCGPGGTGWIGGECLAGGHVQAEPVSLLALPVGSNAWLHPEPCHLVGLKQRPGPKRIGEGCRRDRAAPARALAPSKVVGYSDDDIDDLLTRGVLRSLGSGLRRD
jgi:hypothetical protein